jgi:hypothetical protein
MRNCVGGFFLKVAGRPELPLLTAPNRPVATGSYLEGRLHRVLRRRPASLVERLSVRDELQRLVALRERLFPTLLLRQDVAPRLPR